MKEARAAELTRNACTAFGNTLAGDKARIGKELILLYYLHHGSSFYFTLYWHSWFNNSFCSSDCSIALVLPNALPPPLTSIILHHPLHPQHCTHAHRYQKKKRYLLKTHNTLLAMGEAQLRQLEGQSGFATILLRLSAAPPTGVANAEGVQQAAAICFKNFTKKFWGTGVVSAAERVR